jgi:hypothetical protein
MQQTAALVAPLVAAAAMLTGCTGCSATDGLMTSVKMPADDRATTAASGTTDPGTLGGGMHQAQSPRLQVTDQQRAYLDALTGAGVRPSTDLAALSIGSYVCQAQAAGQSQQAVWDFIHPMVHSDVRNAHLSAMGPTATDVDAATRNYIRIATERLC